MCSLKLFCALSLCILYSNVQAEFEINNLLNPPSQRPLDLRILENLNDKSVLFISQCDIAPDISERVLKAIGSERAVITGLCDKLSYNYTHKNIVVLTSSLNAEIWKNLGNAVKNYENYPMILIISLYDRFSCTDAELMEHAQLFMDNLWRQHQFFHAGLSLPYVCPDSYFIYSERRETEKSLYYLRVKLVPYTWKLERPNSKLYYTQGFPFLVTMFERFPTSILNCEKIYNYVKTNLSASGGFCGSDGLLLADVVQYFGFNVTVKVGEGFGYLLPNGSATDSLLDVTTGAVDASFVSRFTMPDSKINETPLSFENIDCLCAIIRGGKKIPLWHFPSFLVATTSIILVSIFCVVGIISFYLSKLSIYRTNEAGMLFYIIDSIAAGYFGTYFHKKIPKLNQFIKTLLILWSVVFLSYNQVQVNHLFANEVCEKIPSTMQELMSLKVKIYMSESIRLLFDHPVDDSSDLLKRSTLLPKHVRGFKFMLDLPENTAVIRRRADYDLEAAKYNSDEYRLSLVDDPLKCFYLGYITRSDFLFQSDLSQMLHRLTEAGLPDKYYEWTRLSLGYPVAAPPTAAPRPRAAVKMEDLQIAFYLLGAGYIVCLVCFGLEMTWHRCHKKAVDEMA